VTITEILDELPKLSSQELDEIFRHAMLLRQKFIDDVRPTREEEGNSPKTGGSNETI
jgi:hypothetical protein